MAEATPSHTKTANTTIANTRDARRNFPLLSAELVGDATAKRVRSGRGELPDVHIGGVYLPHAVEAHDLRYRLLEVFLRGSGTS